MGFVFFINKKAFLETVDQNIETFRDVLGQDTTAVTLLSRIENEKAFMRFLKNSELLLGILLGYGQHNAQLFARRIELRKYILAKALTETKPLPSQGFSSIEEEEEFLDQKLQSFSRPVNSIPWMILPVQCAADLDHIETKMLQKKYARLRNEISRRYAENNKFLEWIFSQLTADEAPASQSSLQVNLNSRDTVTTNSSPDQFFLSLKNAEQIRPLFFQLSYLKYTPIGHLQAHASKQNNDLYLLHILNTMRYQEGLRSSFISALVKNYQHYKGIRDLIRMWGKTHDFYERENIIIDLQEFLDDIELAELECLQAQKNPQQKS